MKTYDYLKQESEDVIDFIQENYTIQEQRRLLNSKDNDAIESLYERLFNEDCVTGNGSGSYTFNILQAEIGHYYKQRLKNFHQNSICLKKALKLAMS